MKKKCRLAKWFFICSLMSATLTIAHSSEPTIVLGDAKLEQIDATTLILTTSDKIHMQWSDFSIAEGASTQLIQPSDDSIAVIQVEGDSPSFILGTLKANGHVYLINSNGTIIGTNGYIHTNSFLASVHPTCPCNLLEGNEDSFFQGMSLASIVNNGRIKAETKNVYLIGHQIENKGSIDALQGTVALAAGNDVILHPLDREKISILSSLLKTENEETGIDNSGMITACQIQCMADGNAYSLAIRHAGFLNAESSTEHRCEVRLITEHGTIGIFGAIVAENFDETGGKIHIFGEHIALFENSTIDASSENGGGTISIGCADGSRLAETILIDEEVVISADALRCGNGGKIRVGSRELTSFYGTISACGGEDVGDGGYIHIFGKRKLDLKGEIERSAPKGKIGIVFLDPTDANPL